MAYLFRGTSAPQSALNRSRFNSSSTTEANVTSRRRLFGWDGLQNLNTVISMFGVIASILLSIWAIKLTYRFGESTDQIDKLTEISNKQQGQIGQLQAILIESRKQTQLSSKQIGELKLTNGKLVIESEQLAAQVKILSSEQSISNQLRKLSSKGSFMKLKMTASFLGDLFGTELTMNNPDSESRRSAIKKVQRLLESELSNTYLLEHANIAKEWADVYQTSRITEQMELVDNAWRLQKSGQPVKLSDAEAQNNKIQCFNILVMDCLKLNTDMLRQIISKESPTGYF